MRTCHAVVRVAHIASLVLMLAIRASAAGQVIVVDPVAGPGVDFTSVSDAVLAAADGDTVLVHAGTYAASVTVSSKSLAIVAQPGDTVTISGALEASRPSKSPPTTPTADASRTATSKRERK